MTSCLSLTRLSQHLWSRLKSIVKRCATWRTWIALIRCSWIDFHMYEWANLKSSCWYTRVYCLFASATFDSSMFVSKLWSRRYNQLSSHAYLDKASKEKKEIDLTISLRCMQILNFVDLLLLALIFDFVGFAIDRNYLSIVDLVSRSDDVVSQDSKIVAQMKIALTRNS